MPTGRRYRTGNLALWSVTSDVRLTQQARPMSAELHTLCDRWYQAWLAKDAAVVEELAAEDYLYISPAGMVMDRRAILAVIRSPSYRLDACSRSEVVVRGVGTSAAIVRHR